MTLLRRLSISAGIAGTLGATMTVATVWAAGGFGGGAGTFTFSDTNASVNTFNPVEGSSFNLNVDRTTFLFRARPSGAIQSQLMTVLSITQFIPNPDPTQPPTVNATCLVIPDSDFTVSSNLQTAVLNTTNQSNVCPGFIVPITGAVVGKGDGGGGGTIALPISATVTWIGNGVVGVSEDNGTFRCLTFDVITHNHAQQSFSSNVSGQVTAGNAPFASFSGGLQAGVFGIDSTSTNTQNVAGMGILPAACGGKGG